MDLTPTMERFILHWGEMGARWGVNRSVSQVHALLYLSEHPLSAEEISDILGIARSNVSTSLKELLSWKLIQRTHVLGDRRDHFSAETELWTMLMLIVEGRKGREIDPTLNVLRQCVAEGENDPHMPPVALKRIARMLAFMEMLTTWYAQVSRLPQAILVKLLRLGGRISKFVSKS